MNSRGAGLHADMWQIRHLLNRVPAQASSRQQQADQTTDRRLLSDGGAADQSAADREQDLYSGRHMTATAGRQLRFRRATGSEQAGLDSRKWRYEHSRATVLSQIGLTTLLNNRRLVTADNSVGTAAFRSQRERST